MASTTALKGKFEINSTSESDPRMLTLMNGGGGSNAGLYYSMYVATSTGDLRIASNDDSKGGLTNTSYGAWAVNLGGQSDAFSIKRSANTALSYSDVFNITSAGNVGIGSTTPSSQLTVYGGASGATPYQSGAGSLTIEHSSNPGINMLTPNGGVPRFYFGSPINSTAGGFEYTTNATVSSGKLGILAGGATAMTILGSGNVGIGTTTPQSELEINTGANRMVNFWNSNNYNTLSLNGSITDAGHTGLVGGATGDDSLYVDAGG